MIEVEDGIYVAAEHVAVIKKIDDDSCTVFVVGQSAVDGGFLIQKPALEMATDVLEQKREWAEWSASLQFGEDEEPPEEGDEEESEEDEED